MPRVLILGATGPCGILLIRECLAREGYSVVIYARSPSKLPPEIKVHDRVTIVEGQLDDVQALTKAIQGVDAVLSALGPRVTAGPFHSPGSPLAQGYKVLLEVMQRAGCKRLILLGTASIKDKEHDKFSATFFALITGVMTLASTAYYDVVSIGKVVMESDGVDWTIARVPVLTDQHNTEYIAGYVGDGKTKAWLSRPAFARFVVDELERGAWIKKLPLVCSAH
ncbi:NAD(P)-binding protein [Exidia glandulosa HHB12029]|uniref:NAD(P)-binding protein n=1 Tax=Exidia glandulosa HHB12029 TaxID=1314781 RepID=A0A165DQE8_EXIGL|nr:NAD(P)-binding protein [Exidia glandulosa HHB12029]